MDKVDAAKCGDAKKDRGRLLDVTRLTDLSRVGDVEADLKPRTVVWPKRADSGEKASVDEDQDNKKKEKENEAADQPKTPPLRKKSSTESIDLEG